MTEREAVLTAAVLVTAMILEYGTPLQPWLDGGERNLYR
jgi:hypothetical protein